jgi:hypothetical protein
MNIQIEKAKHFFPIRTAKQFSDIRYDEMTHNSGIPNITHGASEGAAG